MANPETGLVTLARHADDFLGQHRWGYTVAFEAQYGGDRGLCHRAAVTIEAGGRRMTGLGFGLSAENASADELRLVQAEAAEGAFRHALLMLGWDPTQEVLRQAAAIPAPESTPATPAVTPAAQVAEEVPGAVPDLFAEEAPPEEVDLEHPGPFVKAAEWTLIEQHFVELGRTGTRETVADFYAKHKGRFPEDSDDRQRLYAWASGALAAIKERGGVSRAS